MHVIDRTDTFTLLGSNARRGKLTLFDAEGPRERGALEHVALRVSDLDAALAELPAGLEVERPRAGEAYFDVGAEGVRLGLVEAETDVDYDLDHVALFSANPEETAGEYGSLGFAPAAPGASGAPRVEVGGACVEFHPGEPGDAGAAAAQPPRRARRVGGRAHRGGERSRRRDRRRRRCAEHLRRVPLGPRARARRVRRAQADVLA